MKKLIVFLLIAMTCVVASGQTKVHNSSNMDIRAYDGNKWSSWQGWHRFPARHTMEMKTGIYIVSKPMEIKLQMTAKQRDYTDANGNKIVETWCYDWMEGRKSDSPVTTLKLIVTPNGKRYVYILSPCLELKYEMVN